MQTLSEQPFILWLSGLSGSGKTTISQQLERRLQAEGRIVRRLDGDHLRQGLCQDLAFSEADRLENLRRAAEVAKLFHDTGIIVIAAFISPTVNIRQHIRSLMGERQMVEVFVNTLLSVCEERDVKGLYEKARRGEIKNFTGIDSAFEIPLDPDVEVNTVNCEATESAQTIYDYLVENKIYSQN